MFCSCCFYGQLNIDPVLVPTDGPFGSCGQSKYPKGESFATARLLQISTGEHQTCAPATRATDRRAMRRARVRSAWMKNNSPVVPFVATRVPVLRAIASKAHRLLRWNRGAFPPRQFSWLFEKMSFWAPD